MKRRAKPQIGDVIDGSGWLILVSCFLSAELRKTTAHLEHLANSFGVTYDGEEIAVQARLTASLCLWISSTRHASLRARIQ